MRLVPYRGELGRPLRASAKAALALEILATYVRVRYLLMRREFRVTVEILRDRETIHATQSLTIRDQLQVAGAVEKTLRILPTDARCLTRSLVLTALLARRGVRPSVVIGVRSAPSFEAHAWVESSGLELLPSGASEYSRLVEI